MSADELRQAAEMLRRAADNATPGVWKLWGMSVMADQDGTSNVDTAVHVAHTAYRDEHGKPRTWDASYIATMHPGVGRAVADWLDEVAGLADAMDEDWLFKQPEGIVRLRDKALTLACLINGGA